jgi:DNA-binding PadR family transcriptional regulator
MATGMSAYFGRRSNQHEIIVPDNLFFLMKQNGKLSMSVHCANRNYIMFPMSSLVILKKPFGSAKSLIYGDVFTNRSMSFSYSGLTRYVYDTDYKSMTFLEYLSRLIEVVSLCKLIRNYFRRIRVNYFQNQRIKMNTLIGKLRSRKNVLIGQIEQIILLAILHRSNHAYGIEIKDEIMNKIQVELTSGALYTTLDRMVRKGLIMCVDPEEIADFKSSRKYFSVTTKGKQILQESISIVDEMRGDLDLFNGILAQPDILSVS